MNERMGGLQGAQLMVGILLGTGCWWGSLAGITSLFRHRMSPRIFGVLNRLLGSLMALFGLIMMLPSLMKS